MPYLFEPACINGEAWETRRKPIHGGSPAASMLQTDSHASPLIQIYHRTSITHILLDEAAISTSNQNSP